MILNKRKIVLVGTGMVGMSFAYSALNQAVCDELVLVDIDRHRAEGEAMDLNHGVAFAPSSMKIYAGDYSDCADADIVVICAGVSQKPGESRLDLLKRNTAVFQSIIGPITHSGFSGIFLVATNPVDIMTRVTYELSGFNSNRVFGTGTTLDTARLRYLLGDYFTVDPRNVHAYVIGEHGDSEFVPWSQAMVATKSVADICEQSQGKFCLEEMQTISVEVRDAAQKIIEAKRATYYGIAMAVSRIAECVMKDEHAMLPVSVLLEGQYGLDGLCLSVPSIVGENGVETVLEIPLDEKEHQALLSSAQQLKEVIATLDLP